MKKSKKSRSKAKTGTSVVVKVCKTSEQAVNKQSVCTYTPTTTELLGAVDPIVLPVVHRYLEAPQGNDKHLLDAWEKIGHHDYKRGQPTYARAAIIRTMTPLGIACIVRYVRGYEDEQATAASELTALERSLLRPEDGASRRPSPGPSQEPRGPASGASSRRPRAARAARR